MTSNVSSNGPEFLLRMSFVICHNLGMDRTDFLVLDAEHFERRRGLDDVIHVEAVRWTARDLGGRVRIRDGRNETRPLWNRIVHCDVADRFRERSRKRLSLGGDLEQQSDFVADAGLGLERSHGRVLAEYPHV